MVNYVMPCSSIELPTLVFRQAQNIHFCVIFHSSHVGAGVRFWLKGTTYQNNSLVSLEDIGEDDTALLCLTDLTVCCKTPYTGIIGYAVGNWFFPNGTRVVSNTTKTGEQWEIFRTRGQHFIYLHRRRGGATGIYRCTIPDGAGVHRNITIGVYTANTGECYIKIELILFHSLDPSMLKLLFIKQPTACVGRLPVFLYRHQLLL